MQTATVHQLQRSSTCWWSFVKEGKLKWLWQGKVKNNTFMHRWSSWCKTSRQQANLLSIPTTGGCIATLHVSSESNDPKCQWWPEGFRMYRSDNTCWRTNEFMIPAIVCVGTFFFNRLVEVLSCTRSGHCHEFMWQADTKVHSLSTSDRHLGRKYAAIKQYFQSSV